MGSPRRATSARPATAEIGRSPGGALRDTGRSRERERDPFAAVLGLGGGAHLGGVIALAVALGTHGAVSARALTSLYPMQHAVERMRDGIHEFFWATYDIELPKPPPKPDEPPPPPPPDPVPEPKAEPMPAPKDNTPPPKDDPYDPPPTPAQAAKVLTAPSNPDEPLDLTDKGFVSGDGTGPGYGMVSAQGTGNRPTYNRAASHAGKPGGTGTGAPQAPPPPSGPDLSRPAGLVGGANWTCPFPPEADVDGVDQAVASVVVTVRPDGTPLSVKVVSDPGHGFGRAARMCALGRRFTPALDHAGQPTTSTTPPIKVRFTR